MREIKFRAWDGGNMYELGHLADIAYTESFSEDWGSDITVYTFMQYTGLRDKNGVKIYEGDILRNTKYEQLVEVFWQEHKTSEDNWISWGGWSFRKLPSDDRMTYALYANHIEVVGSIYENPELLTPTE